MISVTEALRQRISIRQFQSRPVSQALLEELLDAARWSPSGGNLQPWKLIAVAGAERAAVVQLAHTARAAPDEASEEGSDPVYPPNLWEPYRSRRYKVGEDMYALLGLGREDRAARLAQVARNFEFFGAPVGIIFVIDRRLGRAQWAHLGMFMQSLALVAVERGLGSCMQEFWSTLRESLHRHFGLPATHKVYSRRSLGFPTPVAPGTRVP